MIRVANKYNNEHLDSLVRMLEQSSVLSEQFKSMLSMNIEWIANKGAQYQADAEERIKNIYEDMSKLMIFSYEFKADIRYKLSAGLGNEIYKQKQKQTANEGKAI